MSHYQERLEHDLGALRERVAGMAAQVQHAMSNAVIALQKGDHALASETILADHPINRTMREIDAACHAFIAVHLPSGRHLRLLSSVIRVNIALERIGDYAVTVARASEQMTSPPAGHMADELQRFSGEVLVMLGQAVTAFDELNADLAKATMVLETEMTFDLDGIYLELMDNPEHANANSLLTTFSVFTHLKRAADQAKNLCEDAVFAVTGETKTPKVYNILFLDSDDGSLAQMTAAIARKNFPGSGHYVSAGANPSAAIDEPTRGYLSDLGLDIDEAKPRGIDFSEHELSEMHLVVCLQGKVRDYLPQLPFHTTGVNWSLDAPGKISAGAPTEEQLRTLYRELGARISELIHLLRGKDAP